MRSILRSRRNVESESLLTHAAKIELICIATFHACDFTCVLDRWPLYLQRFPHLYLKSLWIFDLIFTAISLPDTRSKITESLSFDCRLARNSSVATILFLRMSRISRGESPICFIKAMTYWHEASGEIKENVHLCCQYQSLGRSKCGEPCGHVQLRQPEKNEGKAIVWLQNKYVKPLWIHAIRVDFRQSAIAVVSRYARVLQQVPP